MLPTKFASMGAPATGGASISRPAEIYVTTDGNNATGTIGNPSKPFLTIAAAVAAGEASAQPYVLHLGVGLFVATRLPASALRRCFHGAGRGTLLVLANSGTSSSGVDALPIHETICCAVVGAYANGWNSDGIEPPGNGAPINIEGWGWVSDIISRGGSASVPSGDIGGIAGDIAIRGNFDVIGQVDFRHGDDGAGAATPGGQFTADGCNLRSAIFTLNNTENIALGRCSYVSGFFNGTLQDKGGNAAW
jgi:hypothetical protein